MRREGHVDQVVASRRATRYPIPGGAHRVEQVVDRSRFICTVAYASTVEGAQKIISATRASMPDATHHCWAYIVGPPGSTDRIGLSDDGEPHGTAGRPMLTVLHHGNLGDVVAVVTRYFGGTKLGTGGLVKAYSRAVQQALETAPRTMYVERAGMTVRVGYTAISAVRQMLSTFEVEILDERFDTDVRFHLRYPAENAEQLRQALMNATRGEAVLETREPQETEDG